MKFINLRLSKIHWFFKRGNSLISKISEIHFEIFKNQWNSLIWDFQKSVKFIIKFISVPPTPTLNNLREWSERKSIFVTKKTTVSKNSVREGGVENRNAPQRGGSRESALIAMSVHVKPVNITQLCGYTDSVRICVPYVKSAEFRAPCRNERRIWILRKVWMTLAKNGLKSPSGVDLQLIPELRTSMQKWRSYSSFAWKVTSMYAKSRHAYLWVRS